MVAKQHVMVLVAAAVLGQPLWAQDPLEKTDREFRAVADSVKKTQETVDKWRSGLIQAEKFLRSKKGLSPAQRSAIQEQIRTARRSLNGYSKRFKVFSKYAGKVTEVFDMVNTVNELRKGAAERRGGPLAGQLHCIAKVMEKFGGEVPILGDAIQMYGQITTGLLDATDKLDKKIQGARNQNMIGAGCYSWFNPKYRALKSQFGADFADGDTYAPSGPRFVYRSINQRGKVCLIWDDETGKWHKLDNPKANVASIYRENLLAGRRRSPRELVVIANQWNKLVAGRTKAMEAYKEIIATRDSFLYSQAYYKVKGEYDLPLWEMLQDPELFRANLLFNREFAAKMREFMTDLRAEKERLRDESEERIAKAKADAAARKLEEEKERKKFLAERKRLADEGKIGLQPKALDAKGKRDVDAINASAKRIADLIKGDRERIDKIVKGLQATMDGLKKAIDGYEKEIARLRKQGSDYMKVCQERMAKAKKTADRQGYADRIKTCQAQLADKSFFMATWGGYYGVKSAGNAKSDKSIAGQERKIQRCIDAVPKIQEKLASGHITYWNNSSSAAVSRRQNSIAYYRARIERSQASLGKLKEKLATQYGRMPETEPGTWEEAKLDVPERIKRELK